jgi:hypothetical protein
MTLDFAFTPLFMVTCIPEKYPVLWFCEDFCILFVLLFCFCGTGYVPRASPTLGKLHHLSHTLPTLLFLRQGLELTFLSLTLNLRSSYFCLWSSWDHPVNFFRFSEFLSTSKDLYSRSFFCIVSVYLNTLFIPTRSSVSCCMYILFYVFPH